MIDITSSYTPSAALGANRGTDRSKCPVFIVGCHRSGTNLLYDTLLSAGGFAVYRGYLPVHKILIPRVGPLDKLENRQKAMDLWVQSHHLALYCSLTIGKARRPLGLMRA